MTTQPTSTEMTEARTPSETWMSCWVGYHLRRMEAVECEADIALLMLFGATEVRRTFEGVPHNLIWRHLVKQREHRAEVAPRPRKITGRSALRVGNVDGKEF